MKPSSLSLRLILLAVITTFIALGATTLVLNRLFYGYFEERIYSELDQYLKQVTANIVLDESGGITVTNLPEPRFNLPFSGLYWQIREDGHNDILSRSLWGKSFDTSKPTTAGAFQRASVVSEHGVPLLTLGWTIVLGDPPDQRNIGITVAIDKSEVVAAAASFRSDFLKWLSLMFLALVLAAWVQVRLGLAPLEAIRKKVELVRSGRENRLQGSYPREVQPLVSEVNELLDLHEKSLKNARDRASDLAHGLKTPLAVMLALARDLRTENHIEMASEIESQVESMRHYIERELARVRTHYASSKGVEAKPVVSKMVEAIRKFPRDTPLEWEVNVPAGISTPFDEHDLSELLGNLLDNARKWAESKIRIEAVGESKGYSSLRIHDDGPGVPEDMLNAIKTRGERLDPDTQGQGLGLAICADMVESYGGKLILSRSPLGGLQIEIRWPENPPKRPI